VHLVGNQCYVLSEVDSSVEVVSVEEYRLEQNSLFFEEIQLQHAVFKEQNYDECKKVWCYKLCKLNVYGI
jgi:hypothetical protein